MKEGEGENENENQFSIKNLKSLSSGSSSSCVLRPMMNCRWWGLKLQLHLRGILKCWDRSHLQVGPHYYEIQIRKIVHFTQNVTSTQSSITEVPVYTWVKPHTGLPALEAQSTAKALNPYTRWTASSAMCQWQLFSSHQSLLKVPSNIQLKLATALWWLLHLRDFCIMGALPDDNRNAPSFYHSEECEELNCKWSKAVM